MKDRYDIVVVGAGPGGSMAAKRAAELGLNVLLVEKRQEIGNPIRCGEGVSKTGIREFLKPDPRWIAADVKGARIFAPDGASFTMSEEMAGSEVGYVLERKVFDRELAMNAAIEGAEVYVKTRAEGLIFKNGKPAGVRLKYLGETREVEASVIIGADGIESKVGRWAGIDTALKLKDVETCAQYLLSGIEVDQDYTEFYLGNEIAPGGYVWIFPKGERKANVGIGILGSRSGNVRAINLLRSFIRDKNLKGHPVELVVGGVPVSRPLDQTVADSVMLVGDAARHSDPITGGGIINAMTGGTLAAETAARAIEAGDASKEALQPYEKGWQDLFGHELHRNYLVKERFIKASDDDLNAIAKSLEGINFKDLTVTGLIKEMIKRNPRILFEIRDLFL